MFLAHSYCWKGMRDISVWPWQGKLWLPHPVPDLPPPPSPHHGWWSPWFCYWSRTCVGSPVSLKLLVFGGEQQQNCGYSAEDRWAPTHGREWEGKLCNFGPAATQWVVMLPTKSPWDQFCLLWPWLARPQQHLAALTGNWNQMSPPSSEFLSPEHHQTVRRRVPP